MTATRRREPQLPHLGLQAAVTDQRLREERVERIRRQRRAAERQSLYGNLMAVVLATIAVALAAYALDRDTKAPFNAPVPSLEVR